MCKDDASVRATFNVNFSEKTGSHDTYVTHSLYDPSCTTIGEHGFGREEAVVGRRGRSFWVCSEGFGLWWGFVLIAASAGFGQLGGC